MAYSWTLAQLRTSVAVLGQYENSQDITPAVLLEVLNDALEETYNICIACSDDYYAKLGPTFTTVAGQGTYALPDDFYNLRKVEQSLNGRWARLLPVPIDTANAITSYGCRYRYRLSSAGLSLYPTPIDGSVTLQLWYIPLAPQLVNDTDTVTFDRPVERKMVIEIALRDCLQRQDLSIAEKQAQIDRLAQQLRTAADSHDSGEPFYLSGRGPSAGDDDGSGWY